MKKKDCFKWTKQCAQAFNLLKDYLTSPPILVMPDWTKPFILDTNACEVGIGTVSSLCDPCGSKHVIVYASRLLTRPEKNYCVTHKELLAVVTFLNHFWHYLLGTPFTIRTDHRALTWLQHFKSPEGQLTRWLENCKNNSSLSFIDLDANTTMQMLYPKFRISNVEEVTPNQLQPLPQQTPLVVLPWKRFIHFSWMTQS